MQYQIEPGGNGWPRPERRSKSAFESYGYAGSAAEKLKFKIDAQQAFLFSPCYLTGVFRASHIQALQRTRTDDSSEVSL